LPREKEITGLSEIVFVIFPDVARNIGDGRLSA
jgi:hypothetical protein